MKWRRCGITYSVSKWLHFLKAAGFQSPDSEVAWVKKLVTEGKTEELMFFPIVWEVTPLWTIRFLFILFRSREKACVAFVPPKEFPSGFIKLLWSCCDCLVPWDVSRALEVYITHIEKRQKNLIQYIDTRIAPNSVYSHYLQHLQIYRWWFGCRHDHDQKGFH